MVDRRRFVRALMATAVTSQAKGFAKGSRLPGKTANDLIPENPSNKPNYWCTWAAQNYMYGHDLPELDPKVLEGDSGSKLAHDAMTEETLFGRTGWAEAFFPKIREDVLFLLDDRNLRARPEEVSLLYWIFC
jgi:hypothetical protein